MLRNLIAVLLFGATLGFQQPAEAFNVGVGAKVGTLGYGLDITLPLSRHFNVRGGITSYDYSYSASESDIDYDFDFGLHTMPLLLDWHPMAGRFRLTAGILLNSNKLKFNAEPRGTYNINGVTYTASEAGSLTGEITFKKNAPYLGLGFGNAVRKRTRVNFVFDLGLMFQGSPKVDLNANGTLAGDPNFQADLAREEQDLENDLDGFDVYPVVALGISVKF